MLRIRYCLFVECMVLRFKKYDLSSFYQYRFGSGQRWLFFSTPGKIRIADGETGEPFNQCVTGGSAIRIASSLVDGKCLHDVLGSVLQSQHSFQWVGQNTVFRWGEMVI